MNYVQKYSARDKSVKFCVAMEVFPSTRTSLLPEATLLHVEYPRVRQDFISPTHFPRRHERSLPCLFCSLLFHILTAAKIL